MKECKGRKQRAEHHHLPQQLGDKHRLLRGEAESDRGLLEVGLLPGGPGATQGAEAGREPVQEAGNGFRKKDSIPASDPVLNLTPPTGMVADSGASVTMVAPAETGPLLMFSMSGPAHIAIG